MNIIHKARVTFVFRGYGDLSLTDHSLFWNKSATSFLTFGAVNALTESHIELPFSEIAEVGTYKYVTGGLKITMKNGAEYKFGFKHKSDFTTMHYYLVNHVK